MSQGVKEGNFRSLASILMSSLGQVLLPTERESGLQVSLLGSLEASAGFFFLIDTSIRNGVSTGFHRAYPNCRAGTNKVERHRFDR